MQKTKLMIRKLCVCSAFLVAGCPASFAFKKSSDIENYIEQNTLCKSWCNKDASFENDTKIKIWSSVENVCKMMADDSDSENANKFDYVEWKQKQSSKSEVTQENLNYLLFWQLKEEVKKDEKLDIKDKLKNLIESVLDDIKSANKSSLNKDEAISDVEKYWAAIGDTLAWQKQPPEWVAKENKTSSQILIQEEINFEQYQAQQMTEIFNKARENRQNKAIHQQQEFQDTVIQHPSLSDDGFVSIIGHLSNNEDSQTRISNFLTEFNDDNEKAIKSLGMDIDQLPLNTLKPGIDYLNNLMKIRIGEIEQKVANGTKKPITKEMVDYFNVLFQLKDLKPKTGDKFSADGENTITKAIIATINNQGQKQLMLMIAETLEKQESLEKDKVQKAIRMRLFSLAKCIVEAFKDDQIEEDYRIMKNERIKKDIKDWIGFVSEEL